MKDEWENKTDANPLSSFGSVKVILYLLGGYFILGGGVLYLLIAQRDNFLTDLLRSQALDYLPIIYTLKNSNIFNIDVAHQLLVFLILIGPLISILQYKYVDFTYLYFKKIKTETVQKIVNIPLCFFIFWGFYYTDWTTRVMQKTLISFPVGFLFLSSVYIFFYFLYVAFLLKMVVLYFQDKK